jgi:hypothetical protein
VTWLTPLVSKTALKNGPAAPELRRDAHDCIMVSIRTDRPNTRLWRDLHVPERTPLGIVVVCWYCRKARPTNAALLVTVKASRFAMASPDSQSR